MSRKRLSLKWGLLASILLCWIAAVLIVTYIAGILIDVNFRRSQEQTVRSNSEAVLKQIQIRLSDCMEASKEVSYDGVVRAAYRSFRSDGDSIALYRSVTEYLSGQFSRDARCRAVFISFWEPEVTSRIYVINEKSSSYQILQQFLEEIRPKVMETMAEADTRICFLVENGQLYMCRNLLDSGFRPYATVTILCDTSVLFQALQQMSSVGSTRLRIDDWALRMDSDFRLWEWTGDEPENTTMYTTQIDGHSFSFAVTRTGFDIWKDLPGLRTAVAAALAAVLPILAVMIALFYKSVTEPAEKLAAAAQRVQDGQWGYCIDSVPNNQEFYRLYQQFNAMSSELKEQFERSRREQQALQQAKIKALQSQINPHFLNNTLEVINWEARIAGNDNVSGMIDALSVMLDAALDRDGTMTVPLRQELRYVDAYLHIISRRLGPRFRVERRIDGSLLDCMVPKLLLQPIVENAVEHDITPRKGGLLEIRICAENGQTVLEVRHEGSMTQADRDNIDRMLSQTGGEEQAARGGHHIGLRNVAARLRLQYGEACSLTVTESGGYICARVQLPVCL